MENHIVMQSAPKIREVARTALMNRWKDIVIFMAIYYLITSAISQVLDLFFYTTHDILIMGEIFTGTIAYGSDIYMFLISGPVSYGISMYLLAFFRNQKAENSMLFEGFSKFGKSFLLMLLIGVKTFLWSLLFVIPGIIAAIRYSQAFYIMIDNPQYTVMQCVEASKRLMLGNKGRYFYLQLTFIGWYLLASIPSVIFDPMVYGLPSIVVMFLTSIPLFFVDAYVNVSNTVFYELAIDNLVIMERGRDSEQMPPL